MDDKVFFLTTVDTTDFGNLSFVDINTSTTQMAPGDQDQDAQKPVPPHTSDDTHSSIAGEPLCGELPSELWSMIMGNLDNRSQKGLAFLWMNIRNVSKSLRAEVERVFKKEHLGKTEMFVDCGCFCWCCNTFHFDHRKYREALTLRQDPHLGSSGFSHIVDYTSFEFDRIEENNPDRAIFTTIHKDQEEAEKAFRGVCYKLGYRDQDPLMHDLEPLPCRCPRLSWNPLEEEPKEKEPSICKMRGGISDCEIIGMELNADVLGISIDWKATVTKIFGRRFAGPNVNLLDPAKDELQLSYLRYPFQSSSNKCGVTLGEQKISMDGPYRTRSADLQLNLNDDGQVGPENLSKGGVGFYFDLDIDLDPESPKRPPWW